MRILFAAVLGIAAVFAIAAWSNQQIVANQAGDVSIDPVVMMKGTTDLPAEQYPAF